MFNLCFRLSYFEKGLILIWLVVQISLLIIFGININLEAEKYTTAAIYLAKNGNLPEPKYIFYSLPIVTIYLFNQIGLSYLGVVLFQILLNGAATVLLYSLTNGITGKSEVARITCLLYIIFLPLQTWNVYLYTESIFFSLTIVFAYLLFKFPPNSIKNFFIALPVLILLITTRPFGLLFILPFVIYAIIISKERFHKILLIISILALGSFLFLINYAFKGGGDMDAMKPFKEEHIICFLANPNPQKIDVIETNKPIYDIAYYIYHNPLHFGKLIGKRLFSFFNLTRPYYSNYHNIYLIVIMFPTYILLMYVLMK